LRSTSTVHQLIHRLLPNAPANLAASGTTASATTLNWDTVAGATGYNVYQDGVVIASPVTNTYNVTGLTTATEYDFFVTATDSTDDYDNESGPSNTVSVTTL
jgi:chitodextrinase